MRERSLISGREQKRAAKNESKTVCGQLHHNSPVLRLHRYLRCFPDWRPTLTQRCHLARQELPSASGVTDETGACNAGGRTLSPAPGSSTNIGWPKGATRGRDLDDTSRSASLQVYLVAVVTLASSFVDAGAPVCYRVVECHADPSDDKACNSRSDTPFGCA